MHDHQPQPPRTFLVPAEDYRALAERLDERRFAEAFLGRWASRAAFGRDLLDENGAASRRLAELPGWLRQYVQIDGEAFAADLERGGLYVIAPVESGVCVFDAGVVRSK